MTAHQRKVSNAFADTNPDFDLGQIGPNHKLILNKFCVVRPQFVLPTIAFEPQSDPLSEADFSALSEVLCRLDGNFVAIFNCGAEAGASVGHKHMQVLPNPEREEFKLFPDMGTVSKEVSKTPTVPFQHAYKSVSANLIAAALRDAYLELASYLSLDLNTPHNVIMTKRWILVIPRRQARIGIAAANAAAMLGMVWVTSEEQYEAWTQQDPITLLSTFGKSWDTLM